MSQSENCKWESSYQRSNETEKQIQVTRCQRDRDLSTTQSRSQQPRERALRKSPRSSEVRLSGTSLIVKVLEQQMVKLWLVFLLMKKSQS